MCCTSYQLAAEVGVGMAMCLVLKVAISKTKHSGYATVVFEDKAKPFLSPLFVF
jgi:hypothetical protein